MELKELEAALEDMLGRETPIDSLVLDVRDNDGGSLTARWRCEWA